MKLKKYNNYLNEDKSEDEYFDEYGSQDDYEGQDDAQSDDDMEHLLYLLRTFLKDSGINNVSLKNSDSSIKLEIVLKTKEHMVTLGHAILYNDKIITIDHYEKIKQWEEKSSSSNFVGEVGDLRYDFNVDNVEKFFDTICKKLSKENSCNHGIPIKITV